MPEAITSKSTRSLDIPYIRASIGVSRSGDGQFNGVSLLIQKQNPQIQGPVDRIRTVVEGIKVVIAKTAVWDKRISGWKLGTSETRKPP